MEEGGHGIPRSHPRYWSLVLRERLVEAMREGIVVPQGLIAHGRGECFDYLIGEETQWFAREAARAAAALLLLAEHPVISVNGNAAALAADELVRLSKLLDAPLEVNLFYRTEERVRRIAELLRRKGARRVLGVEDATARIPGLPHPRGMVSPEGILRADVVLVALEDGDRAEALRRMGKRVIAIDLNPLSRTARMADVTIVDNIVRAVPLIAGEIEKLRGRPRSELGEIVQGYDNNRVLAGALLHIRERLEKLAREGVALNPLGEG
ncbi:hypothetical protein CF15_01835 [Pyrodictium occultum]|uniref:4-phosphopantoate--beta-alanine ligase n=1 Tax=Pyrodictium occultum TaxID=2309 RepID=A0A0V8RU45_PYROC|nr:4-phosphopantoate--beta-alanine ligase [Pyrodictium occultum]KSW11596.1 hypothetical protein CF15_01835 [Pyrodictium occultum]